MLKQFNKLSPAQAERLFLLLEELGETQQAIGKILRHGYESYSPFDNQRTSNRTNLMREIGHIFAAVELLKIDINLNVIDTFKKTKLEMVKKYLHHQ